MFFTSASIGLTLAALAAWALFRALRERRRISSRVQVVVLASLVTVAFVAHLGLLDRDDTSAVLIRLPSPHDHELFHYAIGTRYFAELGYTGLYTATVVADFEDEPERFRPDAVARDLATYRPTTRREMLEHAASVKASFTPERWEAFKADLSPLREAHDPQRWHEGAYTSDHGYNATPLVTSVLGGLGRLFDPGTFLGLAPLLDPYLLALLALAVSALEGAAAALSLLFFLFANPMNEYAFVGGGYLRNGYLVALAAAFATLRAWRPAAPSLPWLAGSAFSPWPSPRLSSRGTRSPRTGAPGCANGVDSTSPSPSAPC